MKNLNKVIASALMGVALVSCNELDTVYEGYYVTSDQKAEVLKIKPEMALAGVTGITANFSRYNALFSARTDWDYGYAGIMLGMDSKTADINSRNVGYNWFASWSNWSDINANGDENVGVWRNEYNQIFSANSVLASIPADTDNDQLKVFRAQALGIRAFNYWVLAQMFQFNYQGNENKPCVPIVTEENNETVAAEGAVRSTVAEVYELIMADLNSAISMSEESTAKIGSYVSAKPRRMLFLDALYGLRARVNLTMGKYADAAKDAQKAIAISSASPLTIEQASKPGFASLEESNWMWGIAIAETDRVVTSGIINNPSHLCSFAYGYVTVGAWRAIATDLYDAIPVNDVRKGWWLDENFESPILTEAQQEYLVGEYGTGSVADTGTGLIPHTNVKFNSYQGVLNQNVNANDIPLMRIEEMYYIAAEGLVMSNQVAEGVKLLTEFETTYRNPNFVCNASSAEDIQDLIWTKRRIEFWGEGLAYFDTMRLRKSIDRRNSGCVPTWRYNIAANDPVRIMQIPENEMQANPALSQSAPAGTPEGNNEQGVRPFPVK